MPLRVEPGFKYAGSLLGVTFDLWKFLSKSFQARRGGVRASCDGTGNHLWTDSTLKQQQFLAGGFWQSAYKNLLTWLDENKGEQAGYHV